ncbi:MAG: RtcB family protein, partial [candidate division Zixibacteria bacterium]|nr:RtcB family protein [candidate division Zixibacteria bacterium]
SLKIIEAATGRYDIQLPDRQLAAVPVKSPEGQAYLGAMRAAANFAWANRQCLAHWTRESFQQVFQRDPKDLGMRQVYDVAHNIAKIETHPVEGKATRLCVHRKGATRAFPAGHPETPLLYRDCGQPVLIPGSMGTASYVLVGADGAMKETFGSTCHGAGRRMSRTRARKRITGPELHRELLQKGISIHTRSIKSLPEEAPYAYKDVEQVVDVVHSAGLALKVARLRPLAVIKG